MSVSQPSRTIYVIDVPEVKHLETKYHYNFFVPDESINETGGLPANVLSRAGEDIDSQFIQYSTTRVPRLVEFNWTAPRLADVGGGVNELRVRSSSNRSTGEQDGSLILRNLDKIVNEDDFSSNYFSSVHFHDGELDNKIHQLVSGSIVQAFLEEEHDDNVSHYRMAQRFIPTLPSHIKPHWIFRAMTLSEQSTGASFYRPTAGSAGSGIKRGAFEPRNGVRTFNDFFRRLHTVSTTAQINTKFMYDLINRTIKDPTATNAHDLVNMHQYSKTMKQAANNRFSPALSEAEFRSFVPFISVHRRGTSPHHEKYGAEIVGYVIDKLEVLHDGTTKKHPPIIIDDPDVHLSADFQVKFNATYCYSIRTIALIKMPAIDDETGDLATIKALVSSKASNKQYVSTLKLNPPPPPSDVNFKWDYQFDATTSRPRGLFVTWAFPVTSERDVKQFQIFRRDSVDHGFELQKVYNFDDSIVPFPPRENPDPRLVERLLSPVTSWRDDEFDWDVHNSPQTARIYAVCALDAHGLTSGYSAQFMVWFDRFKNSLQKRLVSHSGAPKPYPNMYVSNNLFENTIRVRGPGTKRMRLFFNPEFYYLTDDHDRCTKVIQTKQSGGAYKLQFINVDSLKSATVDINIDDRTLQTSRQLSYPTVRFGPKRRPLPRS